MQQTLENIAAIRCRAAARALLSAAYVLSDIDSEEARRHSVEARAAAKIAKQWAKELEKLHRKALRGEGEK